ncbi:unnamed protein product, partial [Ectocarpus fasciculatus]
MVEKRSRLTGYSGHPRTPTYASIPQNTKQAITQPISQFHSETLTRHHDPPVPSSSLQEQKKKKTRPDQRKSDHSTIKVGRQLSKQTASPPIRGFAVSAARKKKVSRRGVGQQHKVRRLLLRKA